MNNYQNDQTITFPLATDKERQNRMILQEVYAALLKKGYNPINQIVGYLLSEDPTYITNYNNARSLIRKIDRDDLLGAMLREYLQNS
ncbi:MAG: IreB family regulatory phosphoprotein [Clostridia bacterium]|nr:IreB family regulatory phosphoprotein [Clostridia bacterium]MBR6744011.1 IreB family regulatory phosphoprotein [Clostridia bacterium]